MFSGKINLAGQDLRFLSGPSAEVRLGQTAVTALFVDNFLIRSYYRISVRKEHVR